MDHNFWACAVLLLHASHSTDSCLSAAGVKDQAWLCQSMAFCHSPHGQPGAAGRLSVESSVALPDVVGCCCFALLRMSLVCGAENPASGLVAEVRLRCSESSEH